MDFTEAYTETQSVERKKRLFWSLQSLEQYYDEKGIFTVPPEVLHSFHVSHDLDPVLHACESRPPPLPRDSVGQTTSTDLGIWGFAEHFGWIWSRVRVFVTECAHNRLKEPWRLDSMYAIALADLTEVENKVSWRHRYDSVKFYERQAHELKLHRNYWIPWLKLQFTYHLTLTVLNHPFLYVMASQYNPNLAIPNTFWRKSSELVLLHATWVVHLVDMVIEKQVQLVDPFFGHAAAIAATVHLYYCCAADNRLRQKSKSDFMKCKKFVDHFVSFLQLVMRWYVCRVNKYVESG